MPPVFQFKHGSSTCLISLTQSNLLMCSVIIVFEPGKLNLFYSTQCHDCKTSLRPIPRSWFSLLTLSNPYGDQAPAEAADVQPISLGQRILFLVKSFYLHIPIRVAKIKRKENINFW